MANVITYNIPASLAAAFRGRRVIVRAQHPSDIVEKLADESLGEISYVRLLDLDADIDGLMGWGHGVPVDLVVSDTCRDLPLLYRYSPILARHPIRVSVPLAPGFGNVVKLAASLDFAVKIEGGQPDESLSDEMQRVAGYYLHQTTVSEPIEFFHSLFLAFYHGEPGSLWAIQEEDPDFARHITDRGDEMLPGRLMGVRVDRGGSRFLRELCDELEGEKGACAGCEFFPQCRGYFKWPSREYRCVAVKELMNTLRCAAVDLRAEIDSFHSRGGGEKA